MAELVTIENAIEILGEKKVITAEQSAKAWELQVPADMMIRYSERTLRKCAEQNSSGKADWRLIYINGFSLWRQSEIHGFNANEQPCFYIFDPSYDCPWLRPYELFWTGKEHEAGYYLINMMPQFNDMTWEDQEQAISDLGQEYSRCQEAIFGEALLTIFLVNDHERIAEDWYHWGPTASGGQYNYIGGFDMSGLRIYRSWGNTTCADWFAVVLLMFDF